MPMTRQARATTVGRRTTAGCLLAGVACLAAALLLGTVPPSAGAAVADPGVRPTTPPEVSSRTIERPRAPGVAEAEALGARALARVRYPWRTELPGWEIVFLPSRPDAYALTYRLDRRIEVFVRADRNVDAVAHDVAHELGHAFDLERNDDAARARYLRLRGLPASTPWWTCDGCGDLQVGAGDFAETFALWAAPPFRFYSELGTVPTPAQVRRIAAQLFVAGPAR